MATALSMGHNISDSEEEDSDDERESPSLLRPLNKSKNTNSNARTYQNISDSDETDIEEPTPPVKKKSPMKKVTSVGGDSAGPSTSKADGSKRKASPCKDERPICKYGSECYRRNKWHMEEFRHPGMSKSQVAF